MIMVLTVMIIITIMMTRGHSSNGGFHPSRCIFAVLLRSFLLRKENEIFCYFSVSIKTDELTQSCPQVFLAASLFLALSCTIDVTNRIAQTYFQFDERYLVVKN